MRENSGNKLLEEMGSVEAKSQNRQILRRGLQVHYDQPTKMKKENAKCVKCGKKIERGTTFLRKPNGDAVHARGDYCEALNEVLTPPQRR